MNNSDLSERNANAGKVALFDEIHSYLILKKIVQTISIKLSGLLEEDLRPGLPVVFISGKISLLSY